MQNQGEYHAEPAGVKTPTRTQPTGLKQSESFFALLLFFAVVGITFGVISIYKNIRTPFVLNASQVAQSGNVNTGSENLAQLRSLDTDSDVLNDYDELYTYNTSPYLADSDSDGLTDKEEVTSGNDPNCPTGQDCTGFAGLGNSNANVTAPTNSTATNSTTNSASLPTTASGDVDLAQLRQILKNSGAPAYIVDGTDDAALLDLYRQVVSESGTAGTNTNAAANSTTNVSDSNTALDADTIAALKNLTADEIRTLLIDSGVDKALIDQASDDDLRQIFQQAIETENLGSS